MVRILQNRAAHPDQEFLGVPPQGWVSSGIDHFDRAANKFDQQQSWMGNFLGGGD